MVKTIEPQAFEIELHGSTDMLLVAFLKRNARFPRQAKVLERIEQIHKGRLRCFLFDPDYLDTAMDRYAVKGTPTFLLLDRGREMSRLIGESDDEGLEEFVSNTVGRRA